MVGYTHNDIKPSNLMIDFQDDSTLKVTLIDFGFAKKFLESQTKTHIKNHTI
jgi:serine/threonine protein kinase